VNNRKAAKRPKAFESSSNAPSVKHSKILSKLLSINTQSQNKTQTFEHSLMLGHTDILTYTHSIVRILKYDITYHDITRVFIHTKYITNEKHINIYKLFCFMFCPIFILLPRESNESISAL